MLLVMWNMRVQMHKCLCLTGNCGETGSPEKDPFLVSPTELRILRNTTQEMEESFF